MNLEEALALIKTFVGTRYDPKVVDALVAACESGQITPGRVRLSQRAKDLAAGKTLAPALRARPVPAGEAAPAA
jgi:HD-GYP domain-containing protein (c-di-GMP phosphodiesterase class II)